MLMISLSSSVIMVDFDNDGFWHVLSDTFALAELLTPSSHLQQVL